MPFGLSVVRHIPEKDGILAAMLVMEAIAFVNDSLYNRRLYIFMRTLANLLTSIIMAVWIVAIAILALKNENLQPVSLKFLTFQSINLPFFLVLVGSAALGMILTALMQPLWSLSGSETRSDDDLDDFSFDE